MSKVQVDTIVDKEDKSAPTLSKGAIVTGVCTATSFVGALTGAVTGNADTATNAQGLTGSPNITVTDVNATGVTTTGIGTVTTSVVVGSAVTANSDGVITSGIITATSFSGSGANLTGITQTTINNNANNRLITGSGTANTLEAESQVTYDGTTLQLRKNGAGEYNDIITDGNPSGDRGTLGLLSGYWDGDRVADIVFSAGDDTSNKNNGIIQFRTAQEGGGNITPRLQIGSLGQIGLNPNGTVGVAATDYGTSGQVITSQGASASPQWATPSAGGWVPVANSTGSSGTLAFASTNCFDGTYDHYRLEFSCYQGDMTTNTQSELRLQQYDGGAYRTANNYSYRFNYMNDNSNTWTGSHTTETSAPITASVAMQAWYGSIDIWNPDLTTVQATWVAKCTGFTYDEGNITGGNSNQTNMTCVALPGGPGVTSGMVAITGFKLYCASNTFSYYNSVLYGFKSS